MSTTKQLLDTKAVSICWQPEGNYLHVVWKGFATSKDYRQILSQQTKFTTDYKAAKIIYDLRKMGVVSAEDQTYTIQVYFPQVAAAGSRYAAIILPESVFGQASVQNILGKKNETLFNAQLFGQTELAIEWIKAQGN